MNFKELITQLFSKNKPIIGLDIGKSEIKMVLLEGTDFNNISIRSYATQSILIDKKTVDKDELVENNGEKNEALEDIKRVSTAIKKCWKKLGTNVRDVAIALPSSAIVSKKTTIPKYDTKEELEEKIMNEIENSMPFSPDEVNVDFQIIGDSEMSPTEQEVLIWATRKEKVDEILAYIDAANLNPVVLDIEHCALINSLKIIEDKVYKDNFAPLDGNKQNQDNKTNLKQSSKTSQTRDRAYQEVSIQKKNISILIDMGYINTKLYVFKNFELVHTRESEIGILNLNNMIMSRFDIESISEVEKLKKSQSLPTEYKLEVLPQFLDNYTSEIARLIDLYFSSTAVSTDSIKGIYLNGGGASLENLKQYLLDKLHDENLKERVLLMSTCLYLDKHSSVPLSALQQDELTLNVATGLALRKFIKKQ